MTSRKKHPEVANDQVSSFIRDLCETQLYGGRCVRLNKNTWEVLDVKDWSEAKSMLLKKKFPALSIHFEGLSRESLTNYKIILVNEQSSHHWTSFTVCVVICGFIFVLAGLLREYFQIYGFTFKTK